MRYIQKGAKYNNKFCKEEGKKGLHHLTGRCAWISDSHPRQILYMHSPKIFYNKYYRFLPVLY